MKTKKASILTKLVVLALLIGVASALLNLRGQIQQAQSDLTQAQAEVAAQKQVNADLADAVENSGDPQRTTKPRIWSVWPAISWAMRGRTSAFSSPRTERGSPG